MRRLISRWNSIVTDHHREALEAHLRITSPVVSPPPPKMAARIAFSRSLLRSSRFHRVLTPRATHLHVPIRQNSTVVDDALLGDRIPHPLPTAPPPPPTPQDEPIDTAAADILREAAAATRPRYNWTRKEIASIYHQPLLELAYQAVSSNSVFLSLEVSLKH